MTWQRTLMGPSWGKREDLKVVGWRARGLREDWQGCMELIVSVSLPGRDGAARTLAQFFSELEDGGVSPSEAKSELAKLGLGLRLPGEVADAPLFGFLLAVPNTSRDVAKLFRGSLWGAVDADGRLGLWGAALRRTPRSLGLVVCDRRRNRMFVNGVLARCVLLSVRNFIEFRRREALSQSSPVVAEHLRGAAR